jgi:hypothetical protein
MTIKRNQHFVPQSYLRKFAIHGQKSLVWEFDKTTGRASIDPVSVRKICSQDFYYYQRTDTGKIDHTRLEDAISEIEDVGIKIINSIRKPRHGMKLSLCEEKKGELSFYIAFLFARGPAIRNGIHELCAAYIQKKLASQYESAALLDASPVLHDLVQKHGLLKIIRPEIFTNVSLPHIVEMAAMLGQSMLAKRWTFYIPENDKYFITSDNPVSCLLQPGLLSEPIGPAHPFSEVTIPLRKDLALVVSSTTNVPTAKAENECVLLTATDTKVGAINRRTAAAALRFIYASYNSSKLLSLFQSVIGASQRFTVDKVKEGTWRPVENPYK